MVRNHITVRQMVLKSEIQSEWTGLTSVVSQRFIALNDSGCQICCTGPESSRVLMHQHTEVPCRR